MTVSVEGPDLGTDRNVPLFLLLQPMGFDAGAGEYRFSGPAPDNLKGRRVLISTDNGVLGSYVDIIR